jgi:hypothetical protein
MKKSLLFIAVIAASMCANAQGIWKATGTEASIAASTDITLTGITGLKCMHSDVAGVIGKTDTGSPTTTYNGVSFDNPAIVQGSTNDMYYAFLPAKSGVMDVALKMGSAKKTFVLELNAPTPLSDLTTAYGTFGGIPAASWTAPSVYDTYNNSKASWNGSTPIQSTGANVYMVISIPVTANKTYVVGVLGSKLMLRGISLTATTNVSNLSASGLNVFPNPACGKVYVNVNEPSEIGIYSIAGSLIKQQVVSSSQNAINISDLHSGIYFIKDLKSSQVQKLIVK